MVSVAVTSGAVAGAMSGNKSWVSLIVLAVIVLAVMIYCFIKDRKEGRI